MNNYKDKRSGDSGFNNDRRSRSYNRNDDFSSRQRQGQRNNRYSEGRPSFGDYDNRGREEGGNRFKFNNRNNRDAGAGRTGYERGNRSRFGGEQQSAGGNNNYRPRTNRFSSEQGNGYTPSPRGEKYNGHGADRKPAYSQRGNYDANAKYNRKKRVEYKEVILDPDAPLRLNKYLANAGICSRREADEFIQAGLVTVNGVIVTEMGTKVTRTDDIRFSGERVNPERKVYILLNKPKDCVTTVDDPQERKTVLDCLKGACKERIYPVGRLDRNTTGVLLLTNDGDMASKLTHPKFMKKKIYHVYCDKNVAMSDMTQLVNGLDLEDGKAYADEVTYVNEADRSQIGIEIHSGKNRIVRRMMEHLGYKVVKLDRVLFAGLTKKNLKRGDWRYLTEKEVNMLRMGAYE
ncbi:MAG: rRNA pseudouridine synthase [Bacteroidaceae bacterium]|nr:rRNA pseudouridine synthase [Bacteroidaceae bacterium]MBR5890673.1 rRNA pseudouridine synthase [Bacteroidaceae bacterium]